MSAGLIVLLMAISAHADPILEKAQDLLRSGRADAATTVYQQYLRQNPNGLAAQLALANIAVRRFEYGKARSILENALARHPESAETAALLGRLYQLQINSPSGKEADNSRNYKALAEEHFRQAKLLGADEPIVLAYLADWQIQQNDLTAADKSLQKALQLDPALIQALQAQTRFYIKTREMQRAKDAALHALELDATDPVSYFLVAQLMAIASRPAEAVQYAQKSEQLDYGRLPERDYFLAAQYEKLGDLPKALQYYENLTVYTPQEASVWFKLGELYEQGRQADKSIAAFRQSIALKPDLADQIITQARENTRSERINMALPQWRRLLTLFPTQPGIQTEAYGNLAGLHMLYSFYKPGQAHPEINQDLELLKQSWKEAQLPEARRLDLLKVRMVLNPAKDQRVSEALRPELTAMTQAQDAAVAGEAFFLLGNYGAAREQWETVDDLSKAEYTRLADRLLLDQELQFSRAFYQRAYELGSDPALETAMKRIDAKRTLAEQRVNEGNDLFATKDYTGAVSKYEEAVHIYRQWDNVYLRLGDTYQKTKQWDKAYQAYETAVSLSPGLLDSPGFSKNYNKLKKKAQ